MSRKTRPAEQTMKSTVICFAILVSGCTFAVNLDTHIPSSVATQRVPVTVEFVAPHHLANRVHDEQGIFWIGAVHTWQFSIGREVVSSSEKIYRLFFQELQTTERKSIDKGAFQLSVEPHIESFNVSGFSLGTEVSLDYEITNAFGNLVHQSRVRGESSFGGPQWTAVFLGIFVGKYALSDSASDALSEAYANLVQDLQRAVQSGVFDSFVDGDTAEKNRDPT